LLYGIGAGSPKLGAVRTVHGDRDLLRRARERTGRGVTATIRQGLELMAASEVYDRLRALGGKVAFAVLTNLTNA
jgi:hypothetical protein